jgi:hypothetical protein
MNNYWEDKYLLVCNVHFYTGTATDDSITREKQRGELFDYFQRLDNKLFPLHFKWENCGVLITGCFNASDTAITNNTITQSIEYKKLLQCFGPARDLLSDSRGRTFDTDNNKYADKKRMNDTSRMDYIFALDSIPGRKQTHQTMPLMAESSAILTDVIISDHYPVAAYIIPVVTAEQQSNLFPETVERRPTFSKNWY